MFSLRLPSVEVPLDQGDCLSAGLVTAGCSLMDANALSVRDRVSGSTDRLQGKYISCRIVVVYRSVIGPSPKPLDLNRLDPKFDLMPSWKGRRRLEGTEERWSSLFSGAFNLQGTDAPRDYD